MEYKIADAHAHIFPEALAINASKSIGDFYQITVSEIAKSSVLIENGREAGIEKFVVCSAATTPSHVKSINDFIAAESRLHSEFIPLGTIHPDYEDIHGEISRIKELGLKGIKLHSDMQEFNIDDKKAYPIYSECQRLGLPILFHMGDNRLDYSAPERLCRVAEDFPELLSIASHFGGYMRWESAYNSFGELFASGKGKNIFFDTSSSLFALDKNKARMMLRDLGEDRFMFGTDFPVWKAEDELRRFMALGLGEEENRKILGLNLEKLFKVKL